MSVLPETPSRKPCLRYASRSHFECEKTPPILPNVPPQSATRYHSLTVPSSSGIARTLLFVDFASQLLSITARIARPESSLVPENGFESHDQNSPRRSMSSGRFSNMPSRNEPSAPTNFFARPRPVTPVTLPDETK